MQDHFPGVLLATLVGLVVGGATADVLTGLADLVIAGGALGAFAGGLFAFIIRADSERAARYTGGAALIGSAFGLLVYVVERIAGG